MRPTNSIRNALRDAGDTPLHLRSLLLVELTGRVGERGRRGTVRERGRRGERGKNTS